MMGDYGTSGGWGWGSWFLMTLTMLVILALVAWGLFLIWRAPSDEKVTGQPQSGQQTPEGILGERFARGEIEAEEYRQRLETLRGGTPSAKP